MDANGGCGGGNRNRDRQRLRSTEDVTMGLSEYDEINFPEINQGCHRTLMSCNRFVVLH